MQTFDLVYTVAYVVESVVEPVALHDFSCGL